MDWTNNGFVSYYCQFVRVSFFAVTYHGQSLIYRLKNDVESNNYFTITPALYSWQLNMHQLHLLFLQVLITSTGYLYLPG